MRRLIVVVVVLVVASGVDAGLWRGIDGPNEHAAGTTDYGVSLGYSAQYVSIGVLDEDVDLQFFKDGVRVSPWPTPPGDSGAAITHIAGTAYNYTDADCDSIYVDRTASTVVPIYWR